MKWLARKLSQIAGWSTEAADKVENFSPGWSIADIGIGIIIGFVIARVI